MVCGTGTTHLCWCIHAGTNLHAPSPISLTRYCTLNFIHSIFLRISRKISHQVNCVSAALRPHFQPLLHLRDHYGSYSGTRGYHFACSHQVWVQISIAYNVNGIDRILHFRFCLTPLMLLLLQPLQAITNTLEDHIVGVQINAGVNAVLWTLESVLDHFATGLCALHTPSLFE
jgi:hypothetical protein